MFCVCIEEFDEYWVGKCCGWGVGLLVVWVGGNFGFCCICMVCCMGVVFGGWWVVLIGVFGGCGIIGFGG